MDVPQNGLALHAETDHEPFPHSSQDSLAPTAVPRRHRAAPLPLQSSRSWCQKGLSPKTPSVAPPADPSYLSCLLKTLLVCTVNDINLP